MIVIKNGTVVTMDDDRTVYFGGHVVIRDHHILAVGEGDYAGELPSSRADADADLAGAEVIDADGMIVMPGLIDLHYHTAVGKGFCDHLPLWEALEEFWYPSIRALDAETAYWAAAASYLESVKSGVTTVNDMYRRLP
ncbi:MAG TPA: amidohydrolase family protein, partial [Candidatus Limnocylindrales bacterium]|nr:amidohydrolase family protein [Candidatus Limnocylindrales bacterium]